MAAEADEDHRRPRRGTQQQQLQHNNKHQRQRPSRSTTTTTLAVLCLLLVTITLRPTLAKTSTTTTATTTLKGRRAPWGLPKSSGTTTSTTNKQDQHPASLENSIVSEYGTTKERKQNVQLVPPSSFLSRSSSQPDIIITTNMGCNQSTTQAEAVAVMDKTADDTNNKMMTTTTKTKKNIIIMGGPASGKGTQCETIVKEHGVVHLSTGQMLRDAVEAQTSVGQEAQSYMESGQLVPDNVMIQIVLDRLDQPDCQERGWLLDGFPRTEVQAKALLDHPGLTVNAFLFLNVSDEELIQRVVGRRMDPVTGAIYHLQFKPPPDDDEVKSRLVQRSDDTVEKMKQRLEVFHANVQAVQKHFVGISVDIDGMGTPDEVSKRVSEALRDENLAAEA